VRVVHLLERILRPATEADDASMLVTDKRIIELFVAHPDNTFLVSFPRAGSHWLRMLMELYFERPSLVRAFFYPERRDYLTLHTHDLELDVHRSHVIYLYRNPVETIYSQLQYHKEDIDDRDRIAYWSDLYGRHLDKWLHRETFTQIKTVVRYERLKDHLTAEFSRICAHFGKTLEVERLETAAAQVTRQRAKEKTQHDPQVINVTRIYEERRQRFHAQHGAFVWQVLLDSREHLRRNF